MLYIIPTPIGNLKDMTFRSVEILSEVDKILAEDTRVTAKLLNHYNISKPVISYHDHNEHKILEKVIQELKSGLNLALVSDAGTPLISDPGYLLVRECYKNDIEVIALPGASALTTALSASGMPTDKFHFEGFLPHKKGRTKRWEFLKEYPGTIVFYESPYRLKKLIAEIVENMDADTLVCVAKEISKIYEKYSLKTAGEHLEYYAENENIKGEYVVIVNNNKT
ncbi:MAG: 16S rRNA (cytidine(1402)-2'-O)-methyltransferase [Saprospiraceae bacterium]